MKDKKNMKTTIFAILGIIALVAFGGFLWYLGGTY